MEKRMHIKKLRKGCLLRAGILAALLCGPGFVMKTKAQFNLDMTGGLMAPTAEMNETGTFMIGGNFMPEKGNPFGYHTGNYFVDFTLFSFLELAYRETLLKTTYMTSKPKFNQQDRSFSLKVQVLKEGKYRPALAIGAHDPYRNLGNNYYRGIYGVATKHLDLKGNVLMLTVGYLGWTGDRNVLQDGVFGSVSFSPVWCRNLSVMAEYDTHQVNLGLSAKLWKHLSLNAFTEGFDCIAGGVRYECTLWH